MDCFMKLLRINIPVVIMLILCMCSCSKKYSGDLMLQGGLYYDEKDELFSGEKVILGKKNQLRYKQIFVEGKPVGEWSSFLEDGSVLVSGCYLDTIDAKFKDEIKKEFEATDVYFNYYSEGDYSYLKIELVKSNNHVGNCSLIKKSIIKYFNGSLSNSDIAFYNLNDSESKIECALPSNVHANDTKEPFLARKVY